MKCMAILDELAVILESALWSWLLENRVRVCALAGGHGKQQRNLFKVVLGLF